jgi:spermidine export protein MdtI
VTAALAMLLLVLAAALDIASNVLLKRSNGFQHRLPGVLALLLVLSAFGLLGLAIRAVPLSIAYAIWGGLGILGTALISRKLDGVRFTPAAWAGLALILGSVAVLQRGG